MRAAALGEDDLIGQFEKELLKTGNAIIHDKVVVVDPLSDSGFVVTGSHNLGYKASYENDETLLIIRGNKARTQAYAVHVLDLWEHYRFRAVREQMAAEGKDEWSGFLESDDHWAAAPACPRAAGACAVLHREGGLNPAAVHGRRGVRWHSRSRSTKSA